MAFDMCTELQKAFSVNILKEIFCEDNFVLCQG